jgi:hypothetical protein
VIAPVKDDQQERPVPDVWRPTLSAIVESLVREEAVIAAELPQVEPVSEDRSEACRNAILRYGDVTLVPLPEGTWCSSVCLWQEDRWNCLVDLWTEQQGRSDLVLVVDVFEDDGTFRFAVNLVYVP